MAKLEPKTSEMQFFMIVRQIRIIGIAIILTLALILVSGIFVSYSNVNPGYAIYNLVTLIICPVLCGASYFLRKAMMNRVTLTNFTKSYFNANVLPFALCEMGGIFCITSSLFINQNIPYALTGFVVTLIFMYLDFPRIEDYGNFKE